MPVRFEVGINFGFGFELAGLGFGFGFEVALAWITGVRSTRPGR